MTTGLAISFDARMARLVLDGAKTQTRRPVKLRGHRTISDFAQSLTPGYSWTFRDARKRWHDIDQARALELLPWRVGARLWAREPWHPVPAARFTIPPNGSPLSSRGEWCCYRANNLKDLRDPRCLWPWRGPKLMPRWASRFTLTLREIRLEPLLAITAFDARAEGLARVSKDGALYKWGIPDRDGWPGTDDTGEPWRDWSPSYVEAFARVWNGLYGPGAAGSDPIVAVLTFSVERRNIDAAAP